MYEFKVFHRRKKGEKKELLHLKHITIPFNCFHDLNVEKRIV